MCCLHKRFAHAPFSASGCSRPIQASTHGPVRPALRMRHSCRRCVPPAFQKIPPGSPPLFRGSARSFRSRCHTGGLSFSRLISLSMTGRGRSPPWPRRAAPHRRPVLFTQIFPHCRGHCGCVQLFELFAEPHVQLFVSLRQIALERAQRLIIQFRFKCYFAQNISPLHAHGHTFFVLYPVQAIICKQIKLLLLRRLPIPEPFRS